jgi:hypothetical protein
MRSLCCLLFLLALAAAPCAADERSLGTPSVRMLTWFPRHDVHVEMIPRRPHAAEEIMLAFSVFDRESKAPLAGPLTVAVEREGLFGRVIAIFPPSDVQHDAGFPGEYTVRVVAPSSGLYRVRVASRRAGPDADATIGFGVWPSGFNAWTVVPLVVLMALALFAAARSRRAGATP